MKMELKGRNQLVSFKIANKEENINSYVGENSYKALGKNSFRRYKKGEILPYILMISLFILLAISFAMKSFDNRNFYMRNYKEYILSEDKSHSNKEYLMGTFNKHMEENIDEIREKTIDVYFKGKRANEFI